MLIQILFSVRSSKRAMPDDLSAKNAAPFVGLRDNRECASMIRDREWTTSADALPVLSRKAAQDFRLFHLDAELVFYKIDSCKDGQERIPLAAAWTSDFSDLSK